MHVAIINGFDTSLTPIKQAKRNFLKKERRNEQISSDPPQLIKTNLGVSLVWKYETCIYDTKGNWWNFEFYFILIAVEVWYALINSCDLLMIL